MKIEKKKDLARLSCSLSLYSMFGPNFHISDGMILWKFIISITITMYVCARDGTLPEPEFKLNGIYRKQKILFYSAKEKK